MDTSEVRTATPNGRPVTMYERVGTNDGALITALLSADEYRLAGRSFTGWAVDVGSHVGTIAVALAVDNPGLQVIALEVVPENVEMVRLNAEANGVADRVHVVGEAAGAPGQATADCSWGYTRADGVGDDYVHDNRFIGNVFREPWHATWDGTVTTVPAVSLGALLDRFGVSECAFIKTDCEGAEWAFFSDSERRRVAEVVGEWHDTGDTDAVRDLFAGTHDVDILEDHGGIGLFRATRRHP